MAEQANDTDLQRKTEQGKTPSLLKEIAGAASIVAAIVYGLGYIVTQATTSAWGVGQLPVSREALVSNGLYVSALWGLLALAFSIGARLFSFLVALSLAAVLAQLQVSMVGAPTALQWWSVIYPLPMGWFAITFLMQSIRPTVPRIPKWVAGWLTRCVNFLYHKGWLKVSLSEDEPGIRVYDLPNLNRVGSAISGAMLLTLATRGLGHVLPPSPILAAAPPKVIIELKDQKAVIVGSVIAEDDKWIVVIAQTKDRLKVPVKIPASRVVAVQPITKDGRWWNLLNGGQPDPDLRKVAKEFGISVVDKPAPLNKKK